MKPLENQLFTLVILRNEVQGNIVSFCKIKGINLPYIDDTSDARLTHIGPLIQCIENEIISTLYQLAVDEKCLYNLTKDELYYIRKTRCVIHHGSGKNKQGIRFLNSSRIPDAKEYYYEMNKIVNKILPQFDIDSDLAEKLNSSAKATIYQLFHQPR